MAHDSFCVL
uniref:Uncharacterized protein n=1 Tax=Anguilla anguilla TaxID=7936 RepID=A0A0E9T1F6_ANGAN